MIVSLRLLSILTVLLQLSTIVSSLTNVPPPGALEGEEWSPDSDEDVAALDGTMEENRSSTRWPWSSSEGSLEDSFERRKRDDVVPDDAVVMNGTTNSTDDSQIEGQTDINAPGYGANEGAKPDPAGLPDDIYDTEGDGQGSRKKRQTYCSGKYSQTDRSAILKYHNDMRSTIARGRYVARGITKPPATDMRKLYWSCALENSAQEVANRCIFAHSNRNGKNTGENLYQYRIRKRWFPNPVPIGGTGIDASRAWEAEFNNIGWPSNRLTRSSFNTGIGHATQMAWWQTSMIGCGVAQCSDNTYQKILVVCHYRDVGNWIDDNIYDSGATCSDCGSGYRCDTYSGLCGV